MKKTAVCLTLALILTVSLAPGASASDGGYKDGDIRWFEHDLPQDIAADLLADPVRYSTEYFPDQNWLFIYGHPLVDLSTGEVMERYNLHPLGSGYYFTNGDGSGSGLMGPDGKVLIEAKYKTLDYYTYDEVGYYPADCLVGVLDSGEREYFTLDGEKLRRPPEMPEGLYRYRDQESRLWGYESEKGTVVIPAAFSEAHPFSSLGLAVVEDPESGKAGLIDTTGQPVTEFIYDSLRTVYNDPADDTRVLFAACVDNKYGLIRPDGTQVTDFLFDSINKFSEGLAAVSVDGKYGFIDTEGNIVIQPTYEAIVFTGSFSGKIASVRADSRESSFFTLIDKSGNQLVPPNQYDYIYARYDLAVARNGGEWHLLNDRGEEVFSKAYPYIQWANEYDDFYGRWVLISDGERFGIYENPNFPVDGPAGADTAGGGRYSFLWWAIPLCVALSLAITAAIVLVTRKKRLPAAEAASPAPTVFVEPAPEEPPREMNFCPKCGQRLLKDDCFCPKCGHTLR